MSLLALALVAYGLLVALPLFCACLRAGLADDVTLRARPAEGNAQA
jgi:hypothetical protein